MVDCEYHDNLARLQADPRSAATLDRLTQPSLFDRLDYWQALHGLCLSGRAVAVLEARSRNGRGAAWLPLMQARPGALESLANWYNFTTGPVLHGTSGEVEDLALLGAIAREAMRHARMVTLSPLADEDPGTDLIVRAFRQAGWMHFAEPADVNHVLVVRGRSFDDYWRERPGQLRSTVKRKSKSGQVQLAIHTAFDEAAWRAYERIYALSWKPEEGSPAFLRALAEAEGAAGSLRLGIATLGGKPVAAQMWTMDHGRALIHKLAHDEEAAAYSPGTLLTAALFQHVIDIDRAELVDFGTGDDPYKQHWMGIVRTRSRHYFHHAQDMRSWPAIARHWLKALRSK